MGYSISIPFKNQSDRDKMVAFFNQTKRLEEFEQLQNKLSPCGSRPELIEGHSLGYLPDVDPNVLAGFQATEITQLNWAVCVWAAVKVGPRDKEGPYIFYDHEKMRIDLSKTHPTNTWANDQGIVQFEREKSLLLRLLNPISNKRITDFVEKINTAWEQEHSPTVKRPAP